MIRICDVQQFEKLLGSICKIDLQLANDYWLLVMRVRYSPSPTSPSNTAMSGLSLVGERIVPSRPFNSIKPFRMRGILSPLIRLCKIKTGHIDWLRKRNSPKRMAVVSDANRAVPKKMGRGVLR